jgi:outer membrane protein
MTLLIFAGALVLARIGTLQATTLQDALAKAYLTNPGLQAARAQLRSVDEGVPQALSGWRPTLSVNTGPGYAYGTTTTNGFATRNNRTLISNGVSLTIPIYQGGLTESSTHQATNNVYAQRARLIATEQQVFTDTVSAYVMVIEAQQTLQLSISNQAVLTRQLEATRARYMRLGEVTLTDVAQAEAALEGAQADRETAQNNLQTARATYKRQVGDLPESLVDPQPLMLQINSEAEASQMCANNNPTILAAAFADAAAKDAIDQAFSALMPTLSVQATASTGSNDSALGERNKGGQVLLSASVPIYQGGAEYSRIRQARQNEQSAIKTLDDTRRAAVLQAVQSWNTLQATRAVIERTRAQVRANQVALDGVTREASIGSRTTLDILNAQQLLLTTRESLVQSLGTLVTNSYGLAAAVGRLTARDLNLNVPLYDETEYYMTVKDKLFGTGDYATSQPGR